MLDCVQSKHSIKRVQAGLLFGNINVTSVPIGKLSILSYKLKVVSFALVLLLKPVDKHIA